MPGALRAFLRHTPLVLAIVGGVLVALVLAFMARDLAPISSALHAWDVAVAIYLVSIWLQTRGITSQHMKEHAADVDDGRYFVLFVCLAAVLASLAAIVLELQARTPAGPTTTASPLGFVVLTVALSWLFVHTSFAKHYAHEYFGPAGGGDIRGGLIFPGDEDPDFGDFFHFAMVIGVANQTADIQISAKPIRRIVTLHGVVALVFNTVVLALAINLAAGLFS